MQSATNAAIVAYNLANAPDMLPREGETDDSETTQEASAQGTSH
jgi:hypothetical protein